MGSVGEAIEAGGEAMGTSDEATGTVDKAIGVARETLEALGSIWGLLVRLLIWWKQAVA